MKCEEIHIRDPFVLVYDNTYYMYGTRGKNAFKGEEYGFDVYKSKDLINWEGPFQMWSDGYVTPKESRCLDGTLYYSRDQKPYMIYCNEWKEVHDGTVCAILLSEDLSHSIGEPRILFKASSAKPFVKKVLFRNCITDGPFLIRTDDEKLHMIWSTYAKTGYVEAMAHSDNDDITGNWTVDTELLYDHDGGHGMIFKDLKGNYQLVLHYPNTFEKEHPRFTPFSYQEGKWTKTEDVVLEKADIIGMQARLD